MKAGYPGLVERTGVKDPPCQGVDAEGYSEEDKSDDFTEPDFLCRKPQENGPHGGLSSKPGSSTPGTVVAKHTAPEKPGGAANQSKESLEPPKASDNKNHRELTTLLVALKDGVAPMEILKDVRKYLEETTKLCLDSMMEGKTNGSMVASILADKSIRDASPYSVKANIFVDCRMCLVKVQVYQQGVKGRKRYFIEFQRCSGCTVMFNTSIFPTACRVFANRENYELLDKHLVEPWLSRPPDFGETHDDDSDGYEDSCCCPADMLEPTLAMATYQDKPNIQCQAACGLFDALDRRPKHRNNNGELERCAKAVAEKLYEKNSDGIQKNREKIEALLDSTSEEVLYPTARVLERLIENMEPRCQPSEDAKEFWRGIEGKIERTRQKMQGSSELVADALGIVLTLRNKNQGR
mmetsp:Transcript_326/g.1391  ORF Transcript_326/g.1391 Transcript_326/m.1391 type:complete len:409 (+) Transcript_326:36-1262(+)